MSRFRSVRAALFAAVVCLLLASAPLLGDGFELIPASAPHGARLTITGTGLDDPRIAVSFAAAGGTTPATIISRTATLIEITVPPMATSGPVRLAMNGATISSLPFTLAPDVAFVRVTTQAASDKAHDLLKRLEVRTLSLAAGPQAASIATSKVD
jgi:hypothetical protein